MELHWAGNGEVESVVVENVTEDYNIVQLDTNDNKIDITELKTQYEKENNIITLWHVNSDFELEVEKFHLCKQCLFNCLIILSKKILDQALPWSR